MKKNLFPDRSILLVDDEAPWLRSMSIALESSGGFNNLIQCQDSQQAMDLIRQNSVGIVLLDLIMPNINGETLLSMIKEDYPDIIVIIVSGMNQVETAVKCMRLGAYDYFIKTSEIDRLIKIIHHALEILELARENREMRQHFLSDTLNNPEAFSEIITNNKACRSIFQYLESIAETNQPVLITGESGVGKELFARAVHRLSKRNEPLVTVNVAGLDDAVFADTIFGHTKGAFTGANHQRGGMIAEAKSGSLFLDEIGDLSLQSQVKLLRLFQEGEYYPIGSDKPGMMKARIIVATHSDLFARQAAGEFRKDLYYRLCAHQVHIPPLRKRLDDLPLLVDYFLEKAAAEMSKKKPETGQKLMALLKSYHFPGNVRELRLMVYNAVSINKGELLSVEPFRDAIDRGATPSRHQNNFEVEPHNPFETIEALPTLSEANQLLINVAMRRSQGNQTVASRILGISQPALSKRLKQLNSDMFSL